MYFRLRKDVEKRSAFDVGPQQTRAENWGAVPHFGGRGVGSPSNTMRHGPRLTFMPSVILIHPAKFGHNTPTAQTRQTGQDRQTTVRQHRANRLINGRSKLYVKTP